MVTLCGFGVSNYYNKLKLILLEKEIPFEEALVYPWQRDTYWESSPLGKIPFIETEDGGLSESQVILDYLEEKYPDKPLYPSQIYSRAKCRELIQHLELNVEWVARRLYKEAFFGGSVSKETKDEAYDKLVIGLEAVNRISQFSPYISGSVFTAADCVAYVHFFMLKQVTQSIYNENLLERILPNIATYMSLMEARPHVQTILSDRVDAMTAFIRTNVKYDG
jgi:glutathione S-transferase